MFKENFTRLCADRGEAPTTVCKNIGLSNAAYSCWDETSVPRKTTLIKIADYFGVTVDSLLADVPDTACPLSDDEVTQRIRRIIAETDTEGREMLLEMLEAAQRAYLAQKNKG